MPLNIYIYIYIYKSLTSPMPVVSSDSMLVSFLILIDVYRLIAYGFWAFDSFILIRQPQVVPYVSYYLVLAALTLLTCCRYCLVCCACAWAWASCQTYTIHRQTCAYTYLTHRHRHRHRI
ncbi:hypothetical protein GGR50DRAFT_653289, partial [Xylaria sp. CBS 124048]